MHNGRSGQGLRGAYGLRLTGLESVRDYLIDAPADWPVMHIERCMGACSVTRNTITDSRAEYSATIDSGRRLDIRVEREPLSARLTTDSQLDDETTVHPALTMVTSIANRWLNRDGFHAGAFLTRRGAWGVLGGKEAGKSTLLGYLAAKGIGIVADDMLTIEGRNALAGVRCVDLREGAAEWLGQGRYLGDIGLRERWRLNVPAVPPAGPICGWILPEWGDDIELTPVPVSARLPILYANVGLTLPPIRPERLLGLAALPFLRFRRPQRWDMMEASAAALWDGVHT